MKTTLLLLAFTLAGLCASAQRNYSFGVSVGTAIALNKPASTPFELHATGWYDILPRLSIGAGVGVSCYEKTLIPLYGSLRFLLTRQRRFTPLIACAAGYGFAPAHEANGGMYLCPELGVQYRLRGGMRLQFTAGYELQQLERLKHYAGSLFSAAYTEQLNHNSITLRIGVLF